MLDSFNREISYLRISITDRCNLRCNYCVPKEGVHYLPKEELLSVQEIIQAAEAAVKIGITKVRITGGEPLVHPDIIDIVRGLSAIDGLKDLSLTTNGVLLENTAQALKTAGLNRVNISLDTVDAKRYESLTQHDELTQVFKGIQAAKKVDLTPIKINCVVFKNSPNDDALRVKEFANEHRLEVRFIHQMNLKTGEFSQVEGGNGGNCKVCNRIRLTANGKVKSCLFSSESYAIRALGAERAMVEAVKNKPSCGTFNKSNEFYNIGG